MTDTSVYSVHCFVKGTNPNIYRNNFELRDKLGRFVTSTFSYSYRSGSDQKGSEAVSTVTESSSSFIESKASALKNIMDLATHTVIRYVENMLNIKIIKLSVDYVIDTKSQLWMLWTSDAQFCRVSSINDIQIPGFPSGDKLGRMTWAGPKYSEGELDQSIRMEKSPTRNEGTRSSVSPHKILEDTTRIKASATEANKLIASAETVIDDSVEVGNLKSTKAGKRRLLAEMNTQKHIVETSEQIFNQNKFPDPFKCKGDFCNLKVHLVGPLSIDNTAAHHIETKLFSEKEISALRKDKRYANMMEFGADGPALAAISMKSIIQARKEKRNGLNENSDPSQSWQEYPTTPREKHTLKHHLEKVI